MNELPKPPRNLIKLAGLLKRKKYRRLEKLSTAEGVKLITEALLAGIPLHSGYFTGETAQEHPQLVKKVRDARTEAFALSPGELARISTLKTPPGCMVIYRTDFQLPARESGLVVALHQISDPGNLGTILRSADWFGVSKVLLSKGSAELHNPAVVRGSMGAAFRLPVEEDMDLLTALQELKRGGLRLIIPALRGGISPRRIEGDAALIMGDEQGRLPEAITALADEIFSIPKLGKGESLNLSVACSILLYEMTLPNN